MTLLTVNKLLNSTKFTFTLRAKHLQGRHLSDINDSDRDLLTILNTCYNQNLNHRKINAYDVESLLAFHFLFSFLDSLVFWNSMSIVIEHYKV